MQRTPDFNAWIAHLRAVALETLTEQAARTLYSALLSEPVSPSTRVRDIRIPLLAHLLGQHPPIPSSAWDKTDDVALWWSLCARPDNYPDVWSGILAQPDGPLLARDDFLAIEVWTESELAALHALWCVARRSRAQAATRLGAAIAWHLEHTQPDNATNHPWALGAFLSHATPESIHFAGTLLSNCRVTGVKPDALSALILLDSALVLDQGLV